MPAATSSPITTSGKSLFSQHYLETRLAATDRLIDQVVYRFYGLTHEEIAVVEGVR